MNNPFFENKTLLQLVLFVTLCHYDYRTTKYA